MKNYKYILIGGGLTGDAAVRGIREIDAEGSIAMFSKEPDPPYARPLLSKGLWKGKPVSKIWRNTGKLGLDLYLGTPIEELNAKEKVVTTAQGEQFHYERLLLATGGDPLRLPFGQEEIIYYRNFQDYEQLHQLTEKHDHFLVIGGGFIGSEVAAALAGIGKQVSMVFLEKGIGANIYPPDLAQYVTDYFREKGVEVLTEDLVSHLTREGDKIVVQTRGGHELRVDGVIAGIGIRPNLALAEQAGLQIENGIVVNEHLQSSLPEVYAAGDVANFFHSALHKRVRVEHEDNAVHMGHTAGRNMAGADENYLHVPMFYSDLFELGYEAVGQLSSKLETLEDWQEPFKKGVIYYLDGDQVKGVLLWNVWGTVEEARRLIARDAHVHAGKGADGLLSNWKTG